jgi:hypothetical protein
MRLTSGRALHKGYHHPASRSGPKHTGDRARDLRCHRRSKRVSKRLQLEQSQFRYLAMPTLTVSSPKFRSSREAFPTCFLLPTSRPLQSLEVSWNRNGCSTTSSLKAMGPWTFASSSKLRIGSCKHLTSCGRYLCHTAIVSSRWYSRSSTRLHLPADGRRFRGIHRGTSTERSRTRSSPWRGFYSVRGRQAKAVWKIPYLYASFTCPV